MKLIPLRFLTWSLILSLSMIVIACSPEAEPTPTNQQIAASATAAPTPTTASASGNNEEKSVQATTGVTMTTASGLQYLELVAGSGESPKPGDIVSVHYTGKLTDGTKFDSSLDQGQPIQFPLGKGQVIQGWDEGIALMKKGCKAILTIPPNLGYGAGGAGGVIPPNATLIFEVELVDIQPGLPPAPEAPTAVNETDYTTTASGLKYYDFVVGSGATAAAGKTVVVHYTGWLLGGAKFDSSLDRGQPFPFLLGMGQVIKGWDEGVAGMQVSGKRQLVIPPDLGYGARGAGGVIPPNATLVFEVELMGVQ